MPELKILETDIAVIGGGLGGVAAALAACEAGWDVVLTEETPWLGGQVTSQAVSALDEHERIETVSGTRTYKAFRDIIRRHYQEQFNVPASMPDGSPLNPGNGWVSRLCFEPRVWGCRSSRRCSEPHLQSGKLRILLRHRPDRLQGDPTHLRRVQLALPSGSWWMVRARLFPGRHRAGRLAASGRHALCHRCRSSRRYRRGTCQPGWSPPGQGAELHVLLHRRILPRRKPHHPQTAWI